MAFGDPVNWNIEVNASEALSSAMQDDPLLTLEQVMLMTKLSKSAIYSNIDLGKFPAPLKVGGSNRWLRQELLDYLLQRVLQRNERYAQKKSPNAN